MDKRKIQEWHLDPELLQKLMTGGADFTVALADYVKKTDIIDKAQLDENCFADILTAIQNIRNSYRKNDVLIEKDDLDAALQELFNQLENIQEDSTGYTAEEIEAMIQANFAEGGIVDERIEAKIPSVTTAVLTELEPDITAINNKANATDERVTLLTQTVEQNKTVADALYRNVNDKISTEDFEPEINTTLQSLDNRIQEIQEQLQNSSDNEQGISVGGNKNQVVIINGTNNLSAVDVVEQIEVATSTEELNAARAELITPILSVVVPQSIHEITLDKWNTKASRTREEENTPELPTPEPVQYTVYYRYTSSDANVELSQAVLNTKPADSEGHLADETITPSAPSQTIITETAGTWTFAGWNTNTATVADSDVTFTGTWDFEAYVPPQTYTVSYRYYDIDIENPVAVPVVVLDTLPVADHSKLSGDYVVPTNPYQDYIFDGDELWHFESWDQEGITIEDSDVEFTGGWSHSTIEEGDTEYDMYRHTYKIQYAYNDGVPAEVLATLPVTVKGILDGTEITPEEPEITSVQVGNRIWTFSNWDAETKTVNGADIIFTGIWVYTTLVYYTVRHAYAGELPAAVLATKPADISDQLSGARVSPSDPSATEVEVEDGTWHFVEWDNTSLVISNADVTFTGTWEFEEKEEEVLPPARVPLTYTNYVLSTSQVKAEGMSVIVNTSAVSGTNASETDSASICIGFYGTRIKLYAALDTIEQAIKITVDNNKAYSITLLAQDQFDEDQGHFCFFCLEQLSEGLHRIEFTVEPGKSFKIDNKVSIDDGNHAGILIANDIPNTIFYENTLYDTGDYLDTSTLTGTYSFTKSENVAIVTSNSYEATAFENSNSQYERRLLYSPLSQKLYYMTENSVLILLSQNYNTRFAELEARIAALED